MATRKVMLIELVTYCNDWNNFYSNKRRYTK